MKNLWEFYSYILVINKSLQGKEASEDLNQDMKYIWQIANFNAWV